MKGAGPGSEALREDASSGPLKLNGRRSIEKIFQEVNTPSLRVSLLAQAHRDHDRSRAAWTDPSNSSAHRAHAAPSSTLGATGDSIPSASAWSLCRTSVWRWEIDLERVWDGASLCDWIFQANGRLIPQQLKDMVDALNSIFLPQRNLCSLGRNKIIRPTEFFARADRVSDDQHH